MIHQFIMGLFLAAAFTLGAIFGASVVQADALTRYREMQMDYNEKMMLRDTDAGSIYATKSN